MLIKLNKYELVYIDDRITIPAMDDDMEVMTYRSINSQPASISATYETVMKIGGAFLEIIDKEKQMSPEILKELIETENHGDFIEVNVDLDQNALLSLREIATSSAYVGKIPVGFSLKEKVHRALQTLEALGDNQTQNNESKDVNYDTKVKMEEFNASTNKNPKSNKNKA